MMPPAPTRIVDVPEATWQITTEVAALARAEGWSSRRSGAAVAIMRAETLDGDAPDGMRRPANLEDAFVSLTGEEIE